MKKNRSYLGPVFGCLLVMLCVGILYLWSVFKTAFSNSFGGWTGVTMVASYMLFAFVSGSFLGGILNDKMGPKITGYVGVILFGAGIVASGFLTPETAGLLILTYCVMSGLGSGVSYAACITTMQKWFPHKRGFATGLGASAFGLSTVVFTPVCKWLMVKFTDPVTDLVNFKPVFVILGVVFLVLGLIGVMAIRLPDEEYLRGLVSNSGAAIVKQRDYSLFEAMKTGPFWFILITIFFLNGTWNLTVPLIYDLGIARGLTAAMATFAVSFTGIPNTVGRLLMSTLSDKIGRPNALFILTGLTLAGALLMTVAGGPLYIIVVGLIAFAYGGPAAILPAMTTDFFGPKNSGTNYGIIMLGLGSSSIVFNAISNTFLHGNPVPTFLMAAVTAVIPIFSLLILNRYRKNWNKEQ